MLSSASSSWKRWPLPAGSLSGFFWQPVGHRLVFPGSGLPNNPPLGSGTESVVCLLFPLSPLRTAERSQGQTRKSGLWGCREMYEWAVEDRTKLIHRSWSQEACNLTKDKRWHGQQLHGNIAPLYYQVLSEWLRSDCLVRDGQATVSGKPREGNQHLGSVHCRLHTSCADLLIKPWWHKLLPYFAWRPRAVSLFCLCLLPAFFLPFLQAHGGSEWQKWVQSYVCLTSEPEFLSITLCHICT